MSKRGLDPIAEYLTVEIELAEFEKKISSMAKQLRFQYAWLGEAPLSMRAERLQTEPLQVLWWD